jgi:hypothetical protein
MKTISSKQFNKYLYEASLSIIMVNHEDSMSMLSINHSFPIINGYVKRVDYLIQQKFKFFLTQLP